LFTQAVARTGRTVFVGRVDRPTVNADSILMVMGLGVMQGDEVELSSPDEDAGEALHELAELLATDLDAR